MTIRRGSGWGAPGPLADDGPIVASDRAAARLLAEARRAGDPLPTIGLVGGDLARTCGSRGDRDRLRTEDARHLPVDWIEVIADDEEHLAVAHVVLRRSWWFGPVVAAMNAQYLGPYDVAPRGHPNDGLLDVVDGDPAPTVRPAIRARLRSGTHVPHPDLRVRRVAEATFDFPRPVTVRVDGVRVGSARHVELRLRPDAWTAVV